MEESAEDINRKASILISRNKPLAFLVGIGGFLASFIGEQLLEMGIQVIGIDDLEVGKKKNLNHLTKNKNFHFLQESIAASEFKIISDSLLTLPRLDYAFFVPETNHPREIYGQGLSNFLNLVRDFKEKNSKEKNQLNQKKELQVTDKPRVILVSSIRLYNKDLDSKDQALKEGEIRFAKFVKYHKLNARVVRLASLFGPRMGFDDDDPLTRLIQSSLTNELPGESVSLDFSSRALYVEDAAHLTIKSIISGSTAQKIFDGANYQPVKVSEIKQILLDPVWHESTNFNPSELPPWPTPNLVKTMKELSWKPKVSIVQALKQTLSYFKENEVDIPKITQQEWKTDLKRWSFNNPELDQAGDFQKNNNRTSVSGKEGQLKEPGIKERFVALCLIALVVFGLLWPICQVLVGAVMIRQNIKSSAQAVSKGDFAKAQTNIKSAKGSLNQIDELINSLAILKRAGVLSSQIDQLDQIVSDSQEGIDGLAHAISGTESLFKATKIISGEENSDPKPLYQKAQSDLTIASQKVEKIKAKFSDQNLLSQFPEYIKARMADLLIKLDLYSELVDKARSASFLLPQITAVDGKKSYLVLLQNNLELRPSGGFIGSYGKFNFENGRILSITVDDIYNLDGGLKEVIAPPEDLRSDLGQQRLYLRDSNYEPDFPSSARTAQVFYNKEAGESVNGVFALDLTASSKLLDAVSGLDLPEYGEHVDGSNLFEKAIAHAEVNFFPGSQAKKNYLTSLENQLFNKIFYLSKQNWPAIIQAVSDSLETKHLLIYLSDPQLFSYLASEDWSGVMPRGAKEVEGQTQDFLATVESNMAANKSNFYLVRGYKLETSIGKEGQVSHKLVINYKNNSPSGVFPGGAYKNRFKIYLPLGAKLDKASFGETDITKNFSSFSDYGRSGYSSLLIIEPKDQKNLSLNYSLKDPIKFKDGKNKYSLDVIKQAGTEKDRFDFSITYPINMTIEQQISNSVSANQELNIATDLLKNRSFEVVFKTKN